MKIKAGKKYETIGGNTFDVKYMGETRAFGLYGDFGEGSVDFKLLTKEIKPRRTITRWTNVYDGNTGLELGFLFPTKEAAIKNASITHELVDTIPITYTEE